jgi:hypothetical protein
MLRKEESFYHPYFEYIGTLEEVPPLWDQHLEVQKLDDPVLKDDLGTNKELIMQDWENIQKICKLYESEYFMDL